MDPLVRASLSFDSNSDRKLAIVTGGNKGIGFAIVKGLCKNFTGDVLLTSRDVEKGTLAVEKLEKLGLKPKFHQLDIGNVGSIDTLAKFIQTNYKGIHILVNNAGIAFNVEDGVPFSIQAKDTIAINYFGTSSVCQGLFPLLVQNAQVVNVSSNCGHLSKIPSSSLRAKLSSPSLTFEQLDELMQQFVDTAKENKHEELGWGKSAYNVSKVGVSALTRIQQRMFNTTLANLNISVNSVHPGYVNTDMTNHKGPLTIEEGAQAPLFLALGQHELKGEYVWRDTTKCDWLAETTPTIV